MTGEQIVNSDDANDELVYDTGMHAVMDTIQWCPAKSGAFRMRRSPDPSPAASDGLRPLPEAAPSR